MCSGILKPVGALRIFFRFKGRKRNRRHIPHKHIMGMWRNWQMRPANLRNTSLEVTLEFSQGGWRNWQTR